MLQLEPMACDIDINGLEGQKIFVRSSTPRKIELNTVLTGNYLRKGKVYYVIMATAAGHDESWEVLVITKDEQLKFIKESTFADENKRRICLEHKLELSQTDTNDCIVLEIEQLTPLFFTRFWKRRNLVISEGHRSIYLYAGTVQEIIYSFPLRNNSKSSLEVFSYDKAFKAREYVLKVSGGKSRTLATRKELGNDFLIMAFQTEGERMLVKEKLMELSSNS